MRRFLVLSVLAGVWPCAGSALAAPNFSPGDSAAWFSQIKLTSAMEAQVNGGKGVKIGLVDTGIVASHYEFTGRVSTASSCAALSFTCSNGVFDDNGHGTATAAIAAGAFDTSHKTSMSGVAPLATIIEEKVLKKDGSGMSNDVSNGIIKAVDAGAQVINLSLTYTPTSGIVKAINYAASKDAIIVFAGGNDSAALNSGANSTGFTAAALSHLVFVGSVDAKNVVSSFSNKPGAGYAYAGSTRDSYASLWLVAPGEKIVAPGVQYGATSYALWSGTSMAAPIVAGALALLETRWPVLARNGTATQVLFQSAHDLGAKGVDGVYGEGLLDLTKAFQPIGNLTVTQVTGKSAVVTPVTAITATGGALGAMSSLRSVLTGYTSFDTFQRDFKVDLSSLVGAPSPGAGSIAQASAPTIVQAGARFAGGEVLMAQSVDALGLAADGRFGGLRSGADGVRASLLYVSLRSDGGAVASLGRGMSSNYSFTQALWGPSAPAADQAGRLGVSGSLLNLAQGGDFGAVGVPVSHWGRLAFSWSSSPNSAESGGLFTSRLAPQASALAIGFTTRLSARWTVGAVYTSLGETSGLLGAVYDRAGLIDLGDRHHSRSLALSSAYDLGGGLSLLVDATRAQTDGSAATGGLIKSVSGLTARAWGVSLVRSNAWREGDGVSLSFRKPLRVISGQAQIAVTSVDAQGYPTTGLTTVGLRPDGDESDLFLGYATPLGRDVDFSAALGYRSDVQNTRGLTDVAARLAVGVRF